MFHRLALRAADHARVVCGARIHAESFLVLADRAVGLLFTDGSSRHLLASKTGSGDRDGRARQIRVSRRDGRRALLKSNLSSQIPWQAVSDPLTPAQDFRPAV